MPRALYRILAIAFATLFACPALTAETVLATFSCQEQLGRDWPRTTVRYAMKFPKGRVRPDRVRLLDQEGEEVPVQLSRVERHSDGSVASALVCFPAELPEGGSYRYQVVDGPAGVKTPNPPRATSQGPHLTLDNGIVAIRLPKAGTVVFGEPLQFGTGHEEMIKLFGRQETAGIAPGPIQGFRILGNRWVGGSYFEAATSDRAPQVLGYTCEITEQGPLFVEARIKYTFDADRYYQLTACVLANDPAVRIDEQYDMRQLGHTRDRHGYSPDDWRVVMSLSSGWQGGGWKPDHAYWGRYAYGSSLQSQNTPLQQRLTELGFDFSSKAFGTHRVSYADPATRLFGVEPWNPYGDYAAYFGLVDSRSLKQQETTPFLAVVPVHAGTWRADGPYGYKSLYAHRSDVALHWPLNALLHPNRVFHTGEHDPELPYTFGRRQWALVGGPLQTVNQLDAFRKYEGYINLDDYKDWTLQWRDDPKVTYPRMFFGKEDVARWSRSLDSHPAGALLKQYLYFQDDPDRREQQFKHVTSPGSHWTSPLGQTLSGLNHWYPLWRQAHMTGQWAPIVDELLSSPELTAEQRKKLRCYVAAVCHLVSEPDFNARGSMAHLGTVNMAIIRFLALTEAAVLIPDHPQARQWLDASEQFVRAKLAANTAPGGGWAELFTYYDASAPALVHATHLLRRTGRMSDEDVSVAEQLAKFPLHYLPPKDPRFGVSVPACWGHEGVKNFGQWLPAAALLREVRPESAKALLWGWDRGGRTAGYHDSELNYRCAAYADVLSALPKDYVPRELVSTWTPGIGAVLRAHGSDPNETYLSYRQGYMLSHCDDNQGDFVLYAKGAPLVSMSLFGYALHQHDPYVDLHLNFGWFSHPRFGSRNNTANMREGANNTDKVGAWNPSSAVHAHAFGPSVDYLRGHTDNERQRWTRQIMLLKGKTATSPNYFVFRDSVDPLNGDPQSLVPKWWNLRTLGGKNQVRVAANALNYTSPFGPKLNVQFLQPDRIRAETRDASRTGNASAHVDEWRTDGQPVMPRDSELWKKTDETLSVTSVGPVDAQQDILVVMYPQGERESAPKAESIANGVAKITTSEGIDWVFLNQHPTEVATADVSFKGRAGAVRVRGNEVHLVLAEGPGEISYKGTVLKSPMPATKVIPVAQLRSPQTIDVPAAEAAITFSLDPKQGEITQVVRGVRRQKLADGYAFSFEADHLIGFFYHGVVFVGRRGGIVVDETERTIRLVMMDGERIGCGKFLAWGCNGPYDLTIHADHVTGRSAGQGRFLNLTQPAGIDKMASLTIDGITYVPGTSEIVPPEVTARESIPNLPPALARTLMVPLMPGEHEFQLRNLPQPPVFREPEEW